MATEARGVRKELQSRGNLHNLAEIVRTKRNQSAQGHRLAPGPRGRGPAQPGAHSVREACGLCSFAGELIQNGAEGLRLCSLTPDPFSPCPRSTCMPNASCGWSAARPQARLPPTSLSPDKIHYRRTPWRKAAPCAGSGLPIRLLQAQCLNTRDFYLHSASHHPPPNLCICLCFSRICECL